MGRLTIGTTGVASKDMHSTYQSIHKGSRVRIIGIDESYGYDLVDKNGNAIIETGFDSIIPDTSN